MSPTDAAALLRAHQAGDSRIDPQQFGEALKLAIVILDAVAKLVALCQSEPS
jgi:hypothetical protein